MNEVTFSSWLSSGVPALYAGLFVLLGWIVRTWPVWKQRITEAKAGDDAIVGAQWARFQNEITRLGTRVAALEKRCDEQALELEECHRDRNTERAGRLEAEALLMGRGRAAQEAQTMLSTEREADRYGRKGDEPIGL